jgi:hypothetical protein
VPALERARARAAEESPSPQEDFATGRERRGSHLHVHRSWSGETAARDRDGEARWRSTCAQRPTQSGGWGAEMNPVPAAQGSGFKPRGGEESARRHGEVCALEGDGGGGGHRFGDELVLQLPRSERLDSPSLLAATIFRSFIV